MSTATTVGLDSTDEERLVDVIRQVSQGESQYEWVEASLTGSGNVHFEAELERVGTEENPDAILSLVVLVGDSYFDSQEQESPPELLSEVDPQLEELEANLEGIISKSLGQSFTVSFERSDSYNGEHTAYVASVISPVSG